VIPALTKTEKTKLAAIILGEISPSAVLFIILSRPQSTKELIALLGPFIPGDTLRAKIAYAITVTRPAFDSDARFREVAEGVLDKLRGVTDDEGETVAVDPAVYDDGFLRFYGRVNLWCAAGEDELRKDVSLCASLGVGYHIEMAGWRSGETAYDSAANLAKTVTMYDKLVEWCKAARIPLFVSITNWNVTQTKYGNTGRPFASIVPTAKKLAETVLACGGQELVYVQPVAETNTKDKAATDFEKWCGNLFAGWKLVYNGGSRPSKPAYGWPHFAYHPNTTADGGKAFGITVSDTGTIIKQLAADGTLDGPGDPAKIAAWFAKCKAAGAIGAGYYAFKREKHDAPAIRACAAPAAVDPAVADAVAFDKLIWNRGGENFSKAVRDPACAITGVKIRGGGTPVLSYGGEGFQKWPVKDENVTHIWAIFFDSDGDGVFERGGKFDWGRSTAADRPLAHLTHYKGWDGYPRKGTPWAAVITDIKGKKRSNVATGVWP
jgi:hypothetical protein